MGLFIFNIFMIISMIFCFTKVCGDGIFDVTNFGAVGDGKTDNTDAFLKTWEQACQSGGTVLIANGIYLVNQIRFKGPCNGKVSFTVNSVVQAPEGKLENFWIVFESINGLTVQGNGTFDGQGPSAWKFNDCKEVENCTSLSTSLILTKVSESSVQDIRLLDSKGFQMKVQYSEHISIDKITITAPADSPNTDGIHTSYVNDVTISNSNIGTGDDCISMGSGTTNIRIVGVNCGPGHGISIGSLGKFSTDKSVNGVHVENCTLSSTTNGARIKTWSSPYALSVSDVTFQDIVMDNARNPIIIDQLYCDNSHDCTGDSSVKVDNVKFIRVGGTSSSNIAVTLNCSSSTPCRSIELNEINLSLDSGGQASSSCSNADVTYIGTQNPPRCQNSY